MSEVGLSNITISDLRNKLKELGLPTGGTKKEMLQRYKEYLASNNQPAIETDDVTKEDQEKVEELTNELPTEEGVVEQVDFTNDAEEPSKDMVPDVEEQEGTENPIENRNDLFYLCIIFRNGGTSDRPKCS